MIDETSTAPKPFCFVLMPFSRDFDSGSTWGHCIFSDEFLRFTLIWLIEQQAVRRRISATAVAETLFPITRRAHSAEDRRSSLRRRLSEFVVLDALDLPAVAFGQE